MSAPAVLRGRSEPVSAALAILRRTKRTGQGGVIVVGGEAGIGKSALITTIVREAETAGYRIGSIKAVTADQLSPGAAMLLALRSGREPLFSSAQLATAASLVDEPVVFVDQLAAMLEEAVGREPAVVAIDDVQWVDDLSLTAARVLSARLAASPLVWLFATREPAKRLAQSLPDSRTPPCAIELGPLTIEDLTDISKDVLGDGPDEFTAGMLARVGGNPFYAVQLLEAVARAASRGEVVTHIPPEFISSLRRRLSPLSELELLLIRLVATLGRPATFDELCSLLEKPAAEVSAAIDTVLAAGLLTYEGHSLTFRHDLVRESVYQELSPGTRKRHHRKCADFMLADGAEPLAAAPHIKAYVEAGDENGAALLMRASEQAAQSMPGTAVELALLAAGTIRPQNSRWHEIGMRAINVLVLSQHGADAVRVADDIVAKPASPDAMAQIESAVAQARWFTGQREELAERTRERLDDAISDASRARLLASSALASIGVVSAETARKWALEAHDLASRANDRTGLESADYTLAVLAMNRGYHAETLQRIRNLRKTSGETYFLNEVIALQLLDRFPDAQRILTEAAKVTRTAALPSLAYGQMWQDSHLNRSDEARAGAQTVIRNAQEFGNHSMEIDAHLILCVGYMVAGDLDAAQIHFNERVRLDEDRDPIQTANTDTLRAGMLFIKGRLGDAGALLKPLLRHALDDQAYWPWWPGWTPLFLRLGLATNDTDLTARTAQLAEEGAARNPGVATFQGLAHHARGVAAGDLGQLRLANESIAESPRPAMRAAIADTFGQHLLRRGSRTEGIAHLDRAWTAYSEIGYAVDAARIQDVMTKAGVRRAAWTARPKPAESGWESLTPTEQKVANLIGSGLTNRVVAAELGISPNTVGTHARSVFSKLDVRSRVQLSNVLHNRPLD